MFSPLNSNFRITYDDTEHSCSQPNLQARLVDLAFTNKTVEWVCADLSTNKPSLFGRIFWTRLGKHLDCIRRWIYNVNLEKSRGILLQLKPQIEAKNSGKLTKNFLELIDSEKIPVGEAKEALFNQYIIYSQEVKHEYIL